MKGIVIATVGLCGTGKSETTEFIEGHYAFDTVYFGGRVLEEVRRRGLEVNKDNERLVREELRRDSGMAVMAILSLPKINASLAQNRNVVIDGLYSYAEYVYLKKELGECFSVVAIHAPKALRYQRLGARPIRPLSPQQVDERDLAEIRNLEKSDPIVLADNHLINDSDLDHLHAQIKKLVSTSYK